MTSTPGTPQTIVVATDFSENARAALAWAVALAREHAAALVLVHGSRAHPPDVPELVSWPQTSSDEIRARVASELDREAEAARRSAVTVDCEVGFGLAFEVVLAAAERRRADLIVAGTRGRTAWQRLLLGSTAARLIRNAHCPVLTVNPDAPPPRPLRTVLVPTDFSEDAALAAETALRLLGAAGADRRMVLLHAYHVPNEATYLPASVLEDAIAAAAARAKRMLGEATSTLRNSGVGIDALACEGEPPDVILASARSLKVDCIAMGTQGLSGMNRLLLGSTAERIVASAPCPVLTARRSSR